jgi:hypothetical protein
MGEMLIFGRLCIDSSFDNGQPTNEARDQSSNGNIWFAILQQGRSFSPAALMRSHGAVQFAE